MGRYETAAFNTILHVELSSSAVIRALRAGLNRLTILIDQHPPRSGDLPFSVIIRRVVVNWYIAPHVQKKITQQSFPDPA